MIEEAMKSLISLSRLNKHYQQGDVLVRALDGVSLSIENGEFTAIVGPSGSGKTTLLNLIGGLDIPTSGDVVLGGIPVSHMSQRHLAHFRRDHIGFIFQAFNLIPVLSVVENIEYVMLLQGVLPKERKKRVVGIMGELGLEGLGGRRPYQLSGGQQQRVAIARAIVAEPKIILADEPTANIDSHTGESIINLMRRLNDEKNMTFIFSTHDRMIRDHAKRVIRLKDGHVEYDEKK